MPYICAELRNETVKNNPATSGELNYAITMLIQSYLYTHPGYSGINDVVGALEGAKLEVYRKVAVPYEDKKCAENGEVYYV